MSAVFVLTFGLIAVGGLLTLVRLLRGPSILDRVVAFDGLAILLVSGVVVESARTGQSQHVGLMVVIVLLSFVASVAASRLVQRRRR